MGGICGGVRRRGGVAAEAMGCVEVMVVRSEG